MKEIILIVLICGLFIFFILTFININKNKSNKPDIKVEAKEEKLKTANKKDDIPDIVKEVTMGNYMFDLSKNETMDGIEMVENQSVEKKVENSTNVNSDIEKAFDEIETIGDDLGDEIVEDLECIENIEDSIIEELDEDFSDDTLLGYDDVQDYNDEKKNHKNAIAEEYKGLSKEMKALIIANILQKKK